MIAAIEALQLVGVVLGIIAGLAALVGVIAGALYIVKSRKITVNNQLSDSAVASLQAANAGLESRLGLVELDNQHCHERTKQQDVVIEQQTRRIDALVEDVTQRAAVSDFRDEVRGLLIPMAQKLGIDPNEHPPIPTPSR